MHRMIFFGVMQLPEKEEGSGHWSWGGGFVLEVPYGAKDPEASYEFIKYLSSPEVQEKFGEKVLISWRARQPMRI